MWRLKQFMPKDQTSLEGKSVEVGSLKLQVRNVIAQGGFSSVYLARDAQTGKSYALKHIICNGAESLDLVRKEVSVMKSLRGHPNVVTLHAQAVIDAGRTKDCFLVMDFCEKTLVNVLESRGAGYFDEKQLLLIFRDVCNAVYGMHSLSPPIAHRDLKAENLLMGPDGLWKLCDFGSTSTNHKRFESAQEMGVEEDNIRKHTTPAYRAPEMWDLYRRERISEKVDIWALGCLLFRVAYFKSAFDGESKLQILNGNYRIPDAPRYSNVVVDLIKDMLVASPESRPDIMQVWRRVNDALPAEYRKPSPDKVAGAVAATAKADPDPTTRVAPSRSPPPPPTAVNDGASVGSFWSTQHAKQAKYDEEPSHRTPVNSVNSHARNGTASSTPAWSADFQEPRSSQKSPSTGEASKASLVKKGSPQKQADGPAVTSQLQNERKSPSPVPAKAAAVSNDGAFNTFVAELDNAASLNKMHEEVDKLKQQLQQALTEKAEYAGKYEKLTAICRSQRQELQELKAAVAAANENSSSGNKEAAKPPMQATSRRSNPIPWRPPVEQQQQTNKQNGSIWELQDGLSSEALARSSQPSVDSWQAFGGDNAPFATSSQQQVPVSSSSSVTNGRRQQRTRAASMSGDSNWDFIQGSLNSDRAGGSSGSLLASESSLNNDRGRGSTSFRASEPSSNKPAGWAGF